jgi:hypothetical protein
LLSDSSFFLRGLSILEGFLKGSNLLGGLELGFEGGSLSWRFGFSKLCLDVVNSN